MKAVFVTLGCKVNQYESRILEERFAKAGIESAKNGEKADFCIINSCTVTASGDKKTRQMLRRLKRQHPDAGNGSDRVLSSGISPGSGWTRGGGYRNRFHQSGRSVGLGADLFAEPPAHCSDYSASERRGI